MGLQQQSPKLSIILAVITAITGLGVALFNNWDRLFSSSEKPESFETPLSSKKSVRFILLDSSGNPISWARVQFIFDGAPEPRYTDDLGYVSISIPRREEVRVIIQKEGFKTIRREINLNADMETTVEYVMYSEINAQESNIVEDGEKGDASQEANAGLAGLEVPEANNLLANVNPSQPSIMEPLDFFNLYFYRINYGLFDEAFQMLSQDYLAKVYFSKGFSFDSALENFRKYWNKCDIEYRDENSVEHGDEAIVFYQARFFCKDDHSVGRRHDFRPYRMVMIKSSDGREWKVKEVVVDR